MKTKIYLIFLLLLLCLSLLSCSDQRTLIIPSSNSLIYGSTYGEDLLLTISTNNTYYNVTTIQTGLLNGFTFNETGEGELKALYSGNYKLDSSWSFNGGANTEYHIRIAVNGIATKCQGERKVGTGNDVGSATTVPCIVTLRVNDKITLQVENIDNTNNVNIHDVGLTALRLEN